MNKTPEIALRLLSDEELKLADSLAMSINPDDPGESWGTNPARPVSGAKQIWGVFMRGSLICALWLSATPGGEARLLAMAVPRSRSRMGLLSFMMDELGPKMAAAGGRELVIAIERGGPVLGEALGDAGFSGPDVEDDGYPAGEWRCSLS